MSGVIVAFDLLRALSLAEQSALVEIVQRLERSEKLQPADMLLLRQCAPALRLELARLERLRGAGAK